MAIVKILNYFYCIVLIKWPTVLFCRKDVLESITVLTTMAHTCNPSYSGVREHEDGGLRPAWEKV
jgi:hypothetical protein